MIRISAILLLVLIVSCSVESNPVEERVQTIELEYVPWACDCANWATPPDIEKYYDNFGDSLSTLSIFVEPAESSIALPDTVSYLSSRIKFTGQFYKEKGYPKGYNSDQPVEKARVFRYTKFEILNNGYKESRSDTSGTN